MATLLRFALLVLAIALCAPPRLPGYWDCEHFSADENGCDIGAMTDDDGGDECAPAISSVRAPADAPTESLVGHVLWSSAASLGTVRGLAASAGVTGPLFRPPRA